MKTLKTDKDAAKAAKAARKLIHDLDEGWYEQEERPQAIRTAHDLLDALEAYHHAADDALSLAERMLDRGMLIRHGEEDDARAVPHFAEAARAFVALGQTTRHLVTVLEWAEVDPDLAEAQEAAHAAIARGLGDDMHYSEDPKRLAAAKQHGGDPAGALALYEAMLAEAKARDDALRTAQCYREIARINEDAWRDKLRATEVLEDALAHADAARHKEAIAMALLGLTDIWMERRDRRTSYAYFQRLEKMRGLKSYQRDMVSMMQLGFAQM